VENYTIQVKNLPSKMTTEELKLALWDHFESYKFGQQNLAVVDVQFAESQKLLNEKIKLGKLNQKKQKQITNFVTTFRTEEDADEEDIKVKDLKKVMEASGTPKAAKQYARIQNLLDSVAKKEERVKQAAQAKSQASAAFVTFEYSSHRDVVINKHFATPFHIACFPLCHCCYKKDHHVLENKFLKTSTPPAPANINWLNMDSKGFERFVRRLFSWLVTIALWVAGIDKKFSN
jgi:hypothetical protein